MRSRRRKRIAAGSQVRATVARRRPPACSTSQSSSTGRFSRCRTSTTARTRTAFRATTARSSTSARAGKSVRAAIGAGYAKGFHTILDANVVTAITALVLFAVATAQVKGFALMLLIGTVISLITAVAATRAMLGLLAGFRWFDNPRFMGAHGQQTAKWLQIDFMRRRYWWFALSGVVILAGVVSLGIRGLNLGIDFKGGTQVTFKTHRAYSTGTVSKFMTTQGQRDAVVQGAGKSVHGDFKQWQVRTRSLTSSKQSNLS